MGGLRSYSAIATKVRAMDSRLLRYEDYEKLAGMESISQVAGYLSKIPAYQMVFAGTSFANGSSGDGKLSSSQRNDIEHLVAGTLYYDFLKLYRFCNGAQKEVLKLYFRKYEIAEIKHTLRHVLNGREKPKTLTAARESMQRFTDIYLDEMLRAQTVSDLAHSLRDTDYRGILEKTGVLEKESLFDCELVLDMFYFTEFWKLKDRLLKKKECQILTENFGTRIDMLNMTWIYRARKYYDVLDASVYGLLIPVRYKLREDDIHEMVAARDLESLEVAMRATYYGRRFQDMELSELEDFYGEFLRKIYADQKRQNPYSIAVVTSYLYAKEEEIKRLTTVLEGIWYGLSQEETLAYLKMRRCDR